MPRALWSGVLAFGLVNVPVALFSATSEKSIRFNQLNKNTGNRIRYRKVDDATGEEVPAGEIVSGYDTGDDEYVMVEREELASVAPGRSELMEISDFVELADIDPTFYRQTYYLAPRGKGADRAYALLRRAMAETGKAGVATMVMRDREHLVVLRPSGHALIVESLYFADEIRDPAEVVGDLPSDSFNDRELSIAQQLIESLAVDWEPDRYHDTYRTRVQELIDSKREGRKVVTAKKAPKTNVIDLMAALEESIAARGGRGGKSSKTDKAKKSSKDAVPTAASDGVASEYADMSKADLLKLAAQADIKGRSSMSKDELAAAVAAAPKPRRSKAS